MKRSFVYLVLTLILSTLLCGCGNMSDRGTVTASPWPEVTDPVLPLPSAAVSPSMMPDDGVGTGTAGRNGDNPVGTMTPGAGVSSPKPAETK